VITINAVIATMMVLLVPRSIGSRQLDPRVSTDVSDEPYKRLLWKCVAAGVLCALFIPPLETFCVRSVYGDAPGRRVGKKGPQMRFGPKAEWRRYPLLKGSKHS
jgi:hypothetical protein